MKAMKSTMKNNYIPIKLIMLGIIVTLGCERQEVPLPAATYSNSARVWDDGFAGGGDMDWHAYADAKLTAFEVDENESYSNLPGSSSMRLNVPYSGDPDGGYAGGIIRDMDGRNLSEYNAVTFYAKGSRTGMMDAVGFGQDFLGDKYAAITSIGLNTNWQKYIIPIPDPSLLTQEKGLFAIAEGPEDGQGYSIWIDQVKYEKLETIVRPRCAIMGGDDVTQKTFIGSRSELSDLTYTVNLPNSVDQVVTTSPYYFAFQSSDTTVAKVAESGAIQVVGQGTAVITAKIGALEASGSLTLESLGEFTAAPVPDRPEDDVISIFSDAYTNAPVEYYNGFWAPFQTTLGGADIVINDDHVIRYTQLNFVGTQFSQPTVDASEKTHFHIDIQVEEDMQTDDFLRITLNDFGPDGSFEGDDNSGGSVTFKSPVLKTGEWVSLDIPLSDFTGLTSTANMAQIVLASEGTIFSILVDNMYFYKDGGGGGTPVPPTSPAPTPTQPAADVISIYSDAYTDVPNSGYNNYGAAAFEEVDISGNKSLKYTFVEGDGGNFQVIELGDENQIDAEAAGMTNFRFDAWFPNAVDGSSTFLLKLVDIAASTTEGSVNVGSASNPVMEQGKWLSFDIPFTNLESNGLGGKANLQQVVIDLMNSGQVYVDNIYMYKTGGGPIVPTTPAPTPSQPEADVISIYSDAYTDVPNSGYNNYGAAAFEEVDISGNKSLKYTFVEGDGGNFQVIELGDENQIDAEAAGMTNFRFDAWFPNAVDGSSTFLLKLVDIAASTTEGSVNVGSASNPVMEQGKWLSFDIPFTNLESNGLGGKANLQQVVIDLVNSGGVYVDNIYMYKTGGGSTAPTTSAPVPPTRDAADVISIYGESYTNITDINYDPNWGQSGHTLVNASYDPGDGNLALAYPSFTFQGTDFDSNVQDASAMEFLHIDIWVPSGTDRQVKVSPINGGAGGTGTGESLVEVPLTPGSWNSVDLAIGDFTGMTWDAVNQLKFDGQFNGDGSANTASFDVYLDNIYFYKTGGGSTAPTTSAPVPPTRDAADVISIYGESYTNITDINYDPDWGQSGHTFVNASYDPGDGNLALAYPSFTFQGTDFDSNVQDASAMEFLHIDIWVPSGTDRQVKVSPINGGAGGTGTGESLVEVPLTPGSWNSVDLAIGDFTGMTWDAVNQLKFDGQFNGDGSANTTSFDVYLDNIYFYKTGGGACADPTAAPTAPTRAAADVISVFSDAYTDIANTNFNPGWGQSTVVTTETIGGESTLKYDNFNFQGTNLGGADGVDQDLSTMEFLHIDIWTCDATVVKVTPISRSSGENLVSLTPIANGQWNSYDIPLSDFSGVSMTDIYQIKFDGQEGTTPSKIFVDNIFFYKTDGGSSNDPDVAAPAPPDRDAANVVSIFSDAYTNITLNNDDAGWCGDDAASVVSIEGNNTWKKNAGIDCHGIDFSTNKQDLSAFTHIHFDFYTDDTDLTGAVFNVKLVDFGGGVGEASALEVNINTGTTPGIVSGSWVSVDIDITSLEGVVAGNLTRSDIAQIGITTANLTNVWYDNIYLYK
jgi:hypothetical protein